ncbi:MAG TPA: ABC transporter ATP-binding protein [Candidatus Limnocylindria bacterium]|nr:ABC transporter ATP-binding protein [Candidatus Limnocylindria bacterium]
MSEAPVIDARGVVKRIRVGRHVQTALDGVDLRVRRGEFSLVLGRSGSGKTTLLTILGGLLAPDEGQVHVLGQDIAAMRPRDRRSLIRREVGWVFQTAGLVPSLLASENVAFALYMNGDDADVDARVAEALRRVGLGARARHRTDELSGGEQQRVALARALVKSPALLLADEPTSQLDAETSRSVVQLIKDVSLAGTTVVVATHDEALEEVADSVTRLEDGRIASN